MKKTIIFLAVLTAMVSAFAATEPVIRYNSIDFTFVPGSARYEATGGSGTAYPGRIDSFYMNPAELAKEGFGISIPSVSMTAFNVISTLKDEAIMADVDKIKNHEADNATYADILQRYVRNLGTGHNLVAQADVSLALKMRQIGFGTNVQLKVHSLSNGAASLTNVTLIPEVNVAQTAGLALNLYNQKDIRVSVGGSAHFIVKQYYRGIAANIISSYILDEDVDPVRIALWDTPVMAGYAVTFDVGATVSYNKTFSFGVSARNLNGTYHMKSYSGEGDFLLENVKFAQVEKPEDHITKDSVEFEIETPWTLNAGIAVSPDWTGFRPVLTLDVADILALKDEIAEYGLNKNTVLTHLTAGIEISLIEAIRVRAGINRGYMSFGAQLNVLFAQIDASYSWREMGENIGDKPVDALTVRFNIGYDR